MKKHNVTKNEKKLTLNVDVLKDLTSQEADKAVGGTSAVYRPFFTF